MLLEDGIAFLMYLLLEMILLVDKITFVRMLSLASVNALGALSIRMMYCYAYKCGNRDTSYGKFLVKMLESVSGIEIGSDKEARKIKVAIVDTGKVGREIYEIPIWSNTDATFRKFAEYEIQEVIFAIQNMEIEKKSVI